MKKVTEIHDTNLTDELRAVFLKEGLIFPTSIEEAKWVDQYENSDGITLPHRLQNIEVALKAGLQRYKKGDQVRLHQSPPTDARTHLAQAAREGGEISKEIEERMRASREEALRGQSENEGEDT